MIYCPNCGTSNRKGSRFCSECGEPLPSTGIRCPMCDTINPVGNIYCQNCNARLVPMSEGPDEEAPEDKAKPIKGFSLPTIPLDEAAEEQEEPTVDQSNQDEWSQEDWLDELRGSMEPAPRRTEDDEHTDVQEPLEPADIPDWLMELGPVSPEPPHPDGVEASRREEADYVQETAPEGPLPDDEPTPDRRSRRDRPETYGQEADFEPHSEHEGTREPDDLPDWLRDLGPVSEQTPPLPMDEPLRMEESSGVEIETDQPPAAEPDSEETPTWPRDILPSEEEEPKPSVPDTAATGEPGPPDEEWVSIEIPDWLREAETGMPTRPHDEPPEDARETELAREAPEIPDWLQEAETGMPARPHDEPPEDAIETELAREAPEIPGQLQEAKGEQEGAPPEEATPPSREPPKRATRTPDWLAELLKRRPKAKDEVSTFAGERHSAEGEWETDLKRADIPEWLQQLRPGENEGDEAVRGPVETEGPLKGLRGLIPATDDVGPEDTFEVPSTSRSSEASLARAELLQSLLGQPTVPPATQPTSEVRESKTDVVSLAERWLVAGILIMAVLVALLTPLVTDHDLKLTEPLEASGAVNLHRTVDGLDATDQVLVAFDYGPAEASELNGVAKPVLAHVLDRGASVSIVSTRPDGLVIAQAVMDEIAQSKAQYTFIGYRPGAANAISQLLAATEPAPTLLLVLTGRPTPLRLWIEQVRARYGDRLPVIAAGSAALEPIASPYLDDNAGQLEGAIHGFKGAASYELIRGAPGSATHRLDALAAGHVAIVVLMIVGALVHAFRGVAERERM